MNHTCRSFRVFFVVLGVLAFAPLADAQASRTWVSGVGDDANPCSRTAPCKTFAGAISKTATGGEISVLDPGGFGAVTITKAITLNGEGTLASILVSGTNGIVVNAPSTDVVRIIHLKIVGISQSGNSGLSGISFIGGKALIVEDSKIYDFNTSCITASGAGLQLTVADTTMTNCVIGVTAQNGAHATVRNSDMNFNTIAGAQAGPGTGILNILNSNLSFNATGAQGNGANSFVNLGNTIVSFNSVLGVNSNGGGLSSFGDNQFVNNPSDGLIPAGAGISIIKK
jgi:hypothetical protein